MPGFFGMTLEEMMAHKHPDAWGRFERGELTEAQFLDSFFADARAFDHGGFCASIRQAYAWLDGMEPLLSRLAQAGHAMHVLSNYPIWYRWIEERLTLSRYVSWSFVSCHLGLRKPDPAIYAKVAELLGVPPAVCVFIDDRERNCDAARAVGMRALRFRGDAARLERELTQVLVAG